MERDACKEAIQNLHKILEEDVSGPLCEKIKAHLEACSSCTQRYQELESLIALCHRLPEEPLPEDKKRMIKETLRKALFKTGQRTG